MHGQRSIYSTDKMGTQDSEMGNAEKKVVYPWLQGIQPNKCPGSTKAIPFNLGPNKPNHPRIGSGKPPIRSGSKSMAGAMTRHQMTQERIMDNIAYFNLPAPDPQIKVLMVGQ